LYSLKNLDSEIIYYKKKGAPLYKGLLFLKIYYVFRTYSPVIGSGNKVAKTDNAVEAVAPLRAPSALRVYTPVARPEGIAKLSADPKVAVPAPDALTVTVPTI
jgi:hypothetical protein